jgi:hypothetical protein
MGNVSMILHHCPLTGQYQISLAWTAPGADGVRLTYLGSLTASYPRSRVARMRAALTYDDYTNVRRHEDLREHGCGEPYGILHDGMCT